MLHLPMLWWLPAALLAAVAAALDVSHLAASAAAASSFYASDAWQQLQRSMSLLPHLHHPPVRRYASST